MPTNIVFTDNNRMANTFLKEIYIGSKWTGLVDGDEMVLWQANSGDHPNAYLLCIGLRSSFDPVNGVVDGFIIIHNGSSGPIKMDTFGIFKGVDCYVVVDWETPWTRPVSQTDQINGVICFGAVIDMGLATDIDNSPTIKRFLLEQHLLDIYPIDLPPCNFTREVRTPIETQLTVNVSNANELVSAIKNNPSVTINITQDIALTDNDLTTIESGVKYLIKISSGRNVTINGNGHKIFDYADQIAVESPFEGRYSVEHTSPVDGTEAFITSNGQMFTLSRSMVYRALDWIVANKSQGLFGLVLPMGFPTLSSIEKLDLYVCYRISYMRFMHKVVSITPQALIFCVDDEEDIYTGDDSFRSLTPQTDFYLVNYDANGSGFTIKDNYLSFPASYPEISLCSASHLFLIRSDARVEINNLHFVGGAISCIRNDAFLYLNNCDITNPSGSGAVNYGTMFVVGCTFHDIKNCGVRTDFLQNMPTPYMEVINNVFRDIGHYGTNFHAVWSSGKSYIAYNEFINTNYSAVLLGYNGSPAVNTECENLVEKNLIHHTEDWIGRRQQLGFQDSGDIYIVGNNKMATVRFNRIINCGGLGKNNGIYVDYWAYNVQIYGNVITGTENYYDIDSRDCSPETMPNNENVLTDGKYPSTNIYVGYNVFDGYIRIQENTANISNGNILQTGCMFTKNFMLRKYMEGVPNNGVAGGNEVNKLVFYNDGEAIVMDSTGIVAAAMVIAYVDGD